MRLRSRTTSSMAMRLGSCHLPVMTWTSTSDCMIRCCCLALLSCYGQIIFVLLHSCLAMDNSRVTCTLVPNVVALCEKKRRQLACNGSWDVHASIYMHSCIYIVVFASMHIYSRACIHACKHASMHGSIHAYTHSYNHAYQHTCMHVNIRVCMQ